MPPLGEETSVQAVVGSTVWAIHRLKKIKELGDERPQLRALVYAPKYFPFVCRNQENIFV